MRLILTLFFVAFLPVFASANDRIDISQYRMLSLMQLPDSNQAVVGVLSRYNQAGFAICDLDGTEFTECRLNVLNRFSVEKMSAVRRSFESELRTASGLVDIDGFEIGAMAALKFNPGQVALYYGLKAGRRDQVTEGAIQTMTRLFNDNPGSPLYVRFPAGADKVRILSALQFAASSH